MDQGPAIGSLPAEKVTPASDADELAAHIINACAQVAEIHRIRGRVEVGSYHDGWNAAVSTIAAKIRELI